MNPALKGVPKKEMAVLLARERMRRKSGEWGEWETVHFLPGQISTGGWGAYVTTAHRNRVFSVLDRQAEMGVRHLAVSSLTGDRPTWHEMQRIKDELAGMDATAIEVYPPHDQIVDGADMFHIWVLPGRLNFGLHLNTIPPEATTLAMRG